jgi:serine/threonine-protein phosphatase 5
VEVITTLLAMNAALPASVFLSRGNHESERVNRIYGFFEEVSKKYATDNMYGLYISVLNTLPLAYVVQDAWFVVHGGLPDKPDFVLEDLDGIDRFCTPENGTLMSQLLWSDPQEANGIAPSHRGEGVLFGPDVTRAFLARNNLSRIIRSHVWEPSGYKVEHDGGCVTIFSAPNYTGTVSPAAFINTDSALNIGFVQFDAASYQGVGVKPRPAMPVMY